MPFSPIGGGASIGGAVTGGTTGSILFIGSGGLTQDNANFFYDDTADRFCLRNTSAVPTGQRALQASDILSIGPSTAESATTRNTIRFCGSGYAVPSASNADSNGDKLVFYNATGTKMAIGTDSAGYLWFQASNFYWANSAGTTVATMVSGLLTTSSTTLHATSVALTNGAGVQAGTLTNAPVAGNPTKWIPISDNGTTRHIPAW